METNSPRTSQHMGNRSYIFRAIIAAALVALVGGAIVLSARSGGPHHVTTAATAATTLDAGTPVPDWMGACLAPQHLSGTAISPALAQTLSATLASGSATSAAVADHPGFSKATMATVPMEIATDGSVDLPVLDSVAGKPVWAVGWTGLSIDYFGARNPDASPSATIPPVTGWIDFVDSTGTVLLGVGCS